METHQSERSPAIRRSIHLRKLRVDALVHAVFGETGECGLFDDLDAEHMRERRWRGVKTEKKRARKERTVA